MTVRKAGLDQSQDEAELSQLMRNSQSGDAESYRQLLTRMRDMLAKYIDKAFARFGIGPKNGPEDVLQEALLAVHVKRQTYQPDQYFLPWMYAIARYKIIDHLRKNRVSARTISMESELENVEDLMAIEPGAEQDLQTLLNTLPEKQKRVLTLVKLEGLSMEETSRKTGYSVSDVKVTVHRAIKTLQDKVKEGGHENR